MADAAMVCVCVCVCEGEGDIGEWISVKWGFSGFKRAVLELCMMILFVILNCHSCLFHSFLSLIYLFAVIHALVLPRCKLISSSVVLLLFILYVFLYFTPAHVHSNTL